MFRGRITDNSFNLIFQLFDLIKKHIENTDVPFTVSCVQFIEYFFFAFIMYVILIMTYLNSYGQLRIFFGQ